MVDSRHATDADGGVCLEDHGVDDSETVFTLTILPLLVDFSRPLLTIHRSLRALLERTA